MRLKAIVASAMAACALSGVMASGAAASGEVVLWPTDQEMAEHPGMRHAATCDMNSWESEQTQFTEDYMIKANKEGKCTESWEREDPLTAEDSRAAKEHVVNASSAKAKAQRVKAKRAKAKHAKAKRVLRSHN
jgi:hypothetical protein